MVMMKKIRISDSRFGDADVTAVSRTAIPASGTHRGMMIIALVFLMGLLSAGYAINTYTQSVEILVEHTKTNAERFEKIFIDRVATRLETLKLAILSLLQDGTMVSAFVRDDRSALIAEVAPFFQNVLLKQFSISKLGFFTPPATVYLQADDLNLFGVDVSRSRRTVVTAIESGDVVTGIETGKNIIGLRAVIPIHDQKRIKGAMSITDPINTVLDHAAAITGLEYAVGMDKERAEQVNHVSDPNNDISRGSDIYYVYSTETMHQLFRHMDFNPRSLNEMLVASGNRKVFVKSFSVNNFAGNPTMVVSSLLDLTEALIQARQVAVIKAVLLFLVLSVIGSIAILQFQRIQAGLTRAISGQRRELAEKTALYEAALLQLKDVAMIKRGFFTHLVGALHAPLQAVTGQLQMALAVFDKTGAITDAGQQQAVYQHLQFTWAETSRLSRLIDDYQQIALFRQNLLPGSKTWVSISELLLKLLHEDYAAARRLPLLDIQWEIPSALPSIRADPEMLHRALAGLVGYAVQCGGQGTIVIHAGMDEEGWLKISFSGSAFAAAGAPTEALLDASRQFLACLAAAPSIHEVSGAFVAVALAHTIIEFYGGSLSMMPPDAAQPGFIVRFPVLN